MHPPTFATRENAFSGAHPKRPARALPVFFNVLPCAVLIMSFQQMCLGDTDGEAGVTRHRKNAPNRPFGPSGLSVSVLLTCAALNNVSKFSWSTKPKTSAARAPEATVLTADLSGTERAKG